MSDFSKGIDTLKREAARKAAKRDRSDMTASDFDAGYRAGRDTRNYNTKSTVKGDYKNHEHGEITKIS